MEVGTCLISLPCRWYSAIIWPQDWFPWRPPGGTLRAPRGWNSDRPRRVSVATARQYSQQMSAINADHWTISYNISFIRGYLWLPDLLNLIPLKPPLYTCRGMQVSSGSADQRLAAKLRSFRGMARIIQSDTQSARGETQKRIIHIILWQGVT